MKTEKRAILQIPDIFTVLRACSALAMAAGLLMGAELILVGWRLGGTPGNRAVIMWIVWDMLAVVSVSALSVQALVSFYRMCGRLKTERAFTNENGKALAHIGRLALICALVTISPALLFMALFVEEGLLSVLGAAITLGKPLGYLALMYAIAGCAARILHFYTARAMALQEENDLTI